MSSAFLLALPVAWVYMFTRQRKGYRASDVQALVLMPVVVAGVVVLVKNSVALAFSLAGIVAAVRFRTNLEDSKDATFIFLSTALGLACGVQLEYAAVLSVLFNAAVADSVDERFARMPPSLEGVRAKRQLERALHIANRTSQFVARLDHEVLEALAPAQLDALEDRLRKRRADIPESARLGRAVRRDDSDPHHRSRIASRGDRPGAGNRSEAMALSRSVHERDRNVGRVRPPAAKGYSRQSLADAVREKGAPHVVGVEIVETEED